MNKLGICWTRLRFKMCWCKWGSSQQGDAFLGRNLKVFAKATSYHMYLAVFTAGVNIYSSREAKGTASALAVNLDLRDQACEQFTAEKRTLTGTGRCPVYSCAASGSFATCTWWCCMCKDYHMLGEKNRPLMPGSTVHTPAKTKSGNGLCD